MEEGASKIEAPPQKSDAEIIGDQIYTMLVEILEKKDEHKVDVEFQGVNKCTIKKYCTDAATSRHRLIVERSDLGVTPQ